MKRYLPALVLILLLTTCPVAAQESIRVIDFEGEVSFSFENEMQWEPLQIGQALSPSHRIRTGNDSRAILLLSNGRLRTIAQNSETFLAKTKTSTQENPIAVIVDYFSKKAMVKKLMAVRSQSYGSEDWIRYLERDNLSLEEEIQLFELVTLFEFERRYNRIIALLTKLGELNEEKPAYQYLVKNAKEAVKNSVDWNVLFVDIGEPVKQAASLQPGDKIRVSYVSDWESYYYLFLTSKKSKNLENPAIKTTRIFPKQNSKRIEKNQKVFIPHQTGSFVIGEEKGNDYLWGVSCFGPVDDLNGLIHKVESFLMLGDYTIESLLRQSKPNLCNKGFSFKL